MSKRVPHRPTHQSPWTQPPSQPDPSSGGVGRRVNHGASILVAAMGVALLGAAIVGLGMSLTFIGIGSDTTLMLPNVFVTGGGVFAAGVTVLSLGRYI